MGSTMDGQIASQLGVGGVVAFLMIKELFIYLKGRDKKDSDQKIDVLLDKITKIENKTDDLYDWHNVTDPSTGAKMWYVQKSLEDSVGKLASAIETQTSVMQGMYQEMRETRRDVEVLISDSKRRT